MKIWAAIFNVFAVLILIVLLAIYRNVSITSEKQFNELRLKQAVEYSAEAAFWSTLETEDISIEYQDMNAVVINPYRSLEVFEELMCLNYNVPPSSENKKHIESFIPVAVLACNNGYYITSLEEIDTTPTNGVAGKEYGLKWSIKKPYTIVNGITTYAVNMSNNTWTSARQDGSNLIIEDGVDLFDKDTIIRTINNQITKDMQYQIDKINANKKSSEIKFYLPMTQTTSGVNPITKPSFMIFVQGVDIASTKKLDAINVSGSRTIRKKVILGFTVGANNYYCYEGQLPEALIPNIKEFYTSIEEAAANGYYPYFEYLTRDIEDEE